MTVRRKKIKYINKQKILTPHFERRCAPSAFFGFLTSFAFFFHFRKIIETLPQSMTLKNPPMLHGYLFMWSQTSHQNDDDEDEKEEIQN